MRNEAHSSLSKTKTEAVFGCSEFGNWELPEAWSLFSPLLGSAPQIVTISQRVNNERKNEGEHSRSIHTPFRSRLLFACLTPFLKRGPGHVLQSQLVLRLLPFPISQMPRCNLTCNIARPSYARCERLCGTAFLVHCYFNTFRLFTPLSLLEVQSQLERPADLGFWHIRICHIRSQFHIRISNIFGYGGPAGFSL